ncbi:carboxypeptidase-like regulatory domain-containing protein [Croceivirga thetidis]|uniref:Carboxypeptidase-like regulatory domain-containing protein n=1 Tax=Croceivirga thetidis TaxID=2721623 RepID=A0ABX1GU93_9FLAO|nr:carboxypeptidase-like regulatory domain-containing protein [Croceivirga thetidis]NKI33194.1 carboxypeptidase-like regulatory domain-containing protein [Croceivirga thetidis]
MKNSISILLIFLFGIQLSAQTISSKLVDSKTKKEIPYATIQYGENKGTITNEEGDFSFVLPKEGLEIDSIYISSMGYEKVGFTLEQLQGDVVFLLPKAIKLSGVYLFDEELDVDEIIDKMKENLPQNINSDPVKQRYFIRQSVFGNIQKIDMGFEKSTIEGLDKKLIDSIAGIIPRNNYHYTEVLGDLYKTNNGTKIGVLKAAELYDKKDVGSFEELGERMETLFKKSVKPDSYLKIKSGIFSQKVQVDEMLDDMEAEEETQEQAELIEKEIQRDSVSGLEDSQRFMFDEILQEVYHEEDTKMDLVQKTRKYAFNLVGYTDIDDQGVYVIDFEPKRNGDFKGRLFVNIEDFAIMRIDFENLRNLKNFRLLGIYYRETVYKGTMRFTKLPNDKYELSFMDFSFGRWFRMDRPLDVIEKNKHVKGRRKQNELRLNIDFQMANNNKWELVVFEQDLIQKSEYDAFTEKKGIEATYMPKYNPEFWDGYNIMEPNQAIREFTVAE